MPPARCGNLEAQAIDLMDGLNTSDEAKVLAIARYYLYNDGGNITQVRLGLRAGPVQWHMAPCKAGLRLAGCQHARM